LILTTTDLGFATEFRRESTGTMLRMHPSFKDANLHHPRPNLI
jgi:hypothetical protein